MLRAQTFRDFEWLVVDNESTDGTTELIAKWQAEADFPIRDIRHPNKGHHGSSNVAAREARGELFLTLDFGRRRGADCPGVIQGDLDDIPKDERHRYSAVTALAVDENGDPTGDAFPSDILDSNTTEIRYRYKCMGEKWGFQRTDVMRAHPYPTIPGYTGMMSSHIIWGDIGRHYLTRYVNEFLGVVYYDQPETLTKGVRDKRRDAIGERLEAGSPSTTISATFDMPLSTTT